MKNWLLTTLLLWVVFFCLFMAFRPTPKPDNHFTYITGMKEDGTNGTFYGFDITSLLNPSETNNKGQIVAHSTMTLMESNGFSVWYGGELVGRYTYGFATITNPLVKFVRQP